MHRSDWPISYLVERKKRGGIALPALQRGYVWKITQVRDLLDSLYREYPIGTFLIWEPPGRKDDIPTRDVAISQEDGGRWTQLLLDGQQRLTSLVAILEGVPITIKGSDRPVEILFNMDHPDHVEASDLDEEQEEFENSEVFAERSKNVRESLNKRTFIVKTKALENEPNWILVTDVLKTKTSNSKLLRQKGIDSQDPRFDKFLERLNALEQIKDRKCDIVILDEKMPYKSVVDIFVRVNSLGTKLKSSDLALAQVTVKWKGVINALKEYMTKTNNKYEIDISIVMRNLAAFTTGRPNFKTLHEESEKKLQASWKESVKGLDEAIDIVQGMGFESPALLSSPYLLNTIAMFAKSKNYRIVGKNREKLRFWLFMASMKGRYSGSTESALEQDISVCGDIDKLISNLRAHVGRFRLEISDIEGMTRTNPLFKILFICMKKNGAKDWYKGGPISLKPASSRNRLDDHHIFPRSVLRNVVRDPRSINDIANMAFLTKETNQKLGKKLPAEYLATIDAELLALHLIPTDPDLWELERYEDFLAERRMRIVEALNDFLQVDKFEK